MAKLQALLAAVLYGLSTFSIHQVIDNGSRYPDADTITNEAWNMTGANLRKAMDLVEKDIKRNDI